MNLRTPPPLTPRASSDLQSFLERQSELFLYQKLDWAEILVGFETANRYALFDPAGQKAGYLIERAGGLGGFLKHRFFGTHRPFQMSLFDVSGNPLELTVEREFYFFFSETAIRGGRGRPLGSVVGRLGFFRRKYDLLDASGRCFARIVSPWTNPWLFPIYDGAGRMRACIEKKWGGFLRELMTDADSYRVSFGEPDVWTWQQRAVFLGAVIAIDMDWFERNQPADRSGILSSAGFLSGSSPTN